MMTQKLGALSAQELDRIEQRLDAATPGPWISYVVGRDRDAGYNRVELGVCNELGTFESIELIGARVADQDFIATARQDVARLLADVRALKAELAALRVTPAVPHGSDGDRGLQRIANVVDAPVSLHSAAM